MRVSLAALAFLLTLAILHSEANEEPAGNMSVCCFSSVTRKIPLSLVKNYERTSDKCPQPGIIFQTRSGRFICADPGQAWVQNYIQYLDQTSK
ncbi:regakine-1 [Bubalus kerabau]|uniref:regakine-1 n=1 Tax=Bubalus bubalis TaxID=89462 RepID=UPI00042CB481|nr:regakine-1 [Bubalus bubalis]XP_055433289.1 regakine-1 [Bubalus carabanensis]